MNVRDRLIAALQPLGLEVRLQGSIAENEPLPETFLTYFIIDSPDGNSYEDGPLVSYIRVQVVLYSTKMSLLNARPQQVFNVCRNAGFIRDSRGRDLGFEGDHYGWSMNFITTERNF
ncbi:MAG: hypothetical protein A2Y20_07685 [Firmicutes bacterium GWF2_51_9]|nr:MAG: hypothetical protein A2Y20_07685 [Firmicutes bacterium GWF2_51_9]OGS58475.1 MAG: hypothetical protein A2Y19_00535 [Firmicutes bacterium GWE2_51_13]HAM63777.1 hypothetical protein [Erysipelotrichaceae bacterium]